MTSIPPPFRHPGPPPQRPELPDGAPVPEDRPDGPLPPLGVPVWAPFLAALVAVIALLIVSIIVGIVVGIAGGGTADLDKDGFTIALTLAQDALLVGSAIAVVWWLGGRPTPAAFGLRLPEWRPALGWTAAAYAAFWVVVIIVGLAFGQPKDQELVTELKKQGSLAVLVGFGVLTCIVAPLTEEFVFRGFLFRVLWERTNVVSATVVSGALFGLVHKPGADWLGVLVLSVLGAILCFVFARTVSLVPCIMLHSFHNSISFGVVKELPWWGFLLLVFGTVTTTLAISLVATRLRPGAPPRAPALSPS
jgi:membrane protease YdiL (CAAX protease family)